MDIQVRQVCRECNQTWMSDLEGTSQELVTSLALYQRTAPLGAQAQIALSAWSYKTAIMTALAYPLEHRYVPDEHYRYFYEERKPPDGTTMFMAGLIPQTDDGTHVVWAKPERLNFARLDGPPIDGHGYRLSITVMALVVQVIYDPHGGRFKRPREFRDVWTRIRPVSKGAWPPGRRIAGKDIEDIGGGRIFSGDQP
jgi:hypothetical protein